MSVDHYLQLVLRPAPDELRRLVHEVAEARGPLAVYDELVQPALDEVAARRQRDELDDADVRRFVEQTGHVLTLLGDRPATGPAAVVARTPENTRHLATTVLAGVISTAGYAPSVLDVGTPFEELVEVARDRGAQLVALCIDHDDELEALYLQLRKLHDDLGATVTILVGGPALRRRRRGWLAPSGVEVARTAGDLATLASRGLPSVAVAS